MPRLALNKSSLARESDQLRTFERFLPSLDLKRRQIVAERAKARDALGATREEIEALARSVGSEIPMLSNEGVNLDDLVRVSAVELSHENVLGARLPVLASQHVAVRDYALLGNPTWVDRVAEVLVRVLELRVRAQVEERRLALLDMAVQKITQRVNLFEKVLIPRARSHIKRIQIHLSDAERTGVVQAKIAKGKRKREAAL